MASTDLTTFALAFGVVWAGLGGYLYWLHRESARLAREVNDLKAKFK